LGYFSSVAIHTIGEKSKFFDIQEKLFQEIELNDVQEDNLYFLDTTSCLSKEEYRAFGKSLWFNFCWEGINEKLAQGKLYFFEEKWGYYNDQWINLSKVLNKKLFSWQFLRVGQEENDEETKTNKWFLETLFIAEVTKYYKIEDSNINFDKAG